MSLLITPAAAAARVVTAPAAIVASVIFAEVAAVGGILIYLFCWLLGRRHEAAPSS